MMFGRRSIAAMALTLLSLGAPALAQSPSTTSQETLVLPAKPLIGSGSRARAIEIMGATQTTPTTSVFSSRSDHILTQMERECAEHAHQAWTDATKGVSSAAGAAGSYKLWKATNLAGSEVPEVRAEQMNSLSKFLRANALSEKQVVTSAKLFERNLTKVRGVAGVLTVIFSVIVIDTFLESKPSFAEVTSPYATSVLCSTNGGSGPKSVRYQALDAVLSGK